MVEGGRADKFAKKAAYYEKVRALFQEYSRILLVDADNVGSNQMQTIRSAIRGRAVLLMGKNSMIRRAVRSLVEENPALDNLLPLLVGNVGIVFTHEEPADIRAVIAENRVGAPAKAGAIAPVDVNVPAGPTGMEPGLTSFFQALNIATKIARGQIEIIADVSLVSKGEKVSMSEAVLLQKLNINPFSYGLEAKTIYDNGVIFDAEVLDLTSEDFSKMLVDAARDIGAISLAVDFPTVVSVPHSILNGFKEIMLISLGSDHTIKEIAELKALLDDPEALAAAQAAAAASAPAAGGAGAAAAKEPEPEPEPEEESDEDMGFGLFD